MSSVQDLILGQKEQESNNLNWSATCSYYALVHGGRLVCFLGLGDYPMQHAELRNLLSAVKHDSAAMFTHSIGRAASRISVTIVGISPDRRSISSRDDRSLPKPSQRCRRSPASHELGQGAWTSL